jgi:hypothetical protein
MNSLRYLTDNCYFLGSETDNLRNNDNDTKHYDLIAFDGAEILTIFDALSLNLCKMHDLNRGQSITSIISATL